MTKFVAANPELNRHLVGEHGWMFRYDGYDYCLCMHRLYSVATGCGIWVDELTYPDYFEELPGALQEPEGSEV